MDISEIKQSKKIEAFWLDPNSPKVVVLKFIQPWRWVDFVEFMHANYDFLLSVDQPFALMYDAMRFPITENRVAQVYDNLVTKAPPNPPKLALVVMLDPQNALNLSVSFEILMRATSRKRILHIVNSREAATQVLANNGFM